MRARTVPLSEGRSDFRRISGLSLFRSPRICGRGERNADVVRHLNVVTSEPRPIIDYVYDYDYISVRHLTFDSYKI